MPQAVLAEAATECPVVALLDHDDNGRAARDKLKSFHWEPSKRILSLSAWPDRCGSHDVEIEDLLPPGPVAAIVAEMGEDKALDGKIRCGKGWHFELSKAWKDAAIDMLEPRLDGDPGGIVWLAEELHYRATLIAASKAPAAAATV